MTLAGAFCIFAHEEHRTDGSMDDRFKERISAALMGDLLVALAQHEKIKKMFGEMDAWAADELIRQLLDEFEKTVQRRHDQILSEQAGSLAEQTPVAPQPGAAPPDVPAEGENKGDSAMSLPFSQLFNRGEGTVPDAASFGLAGELAESARQILGHSFPGAPGPPAAPSTQEPEGTRGAFPSAKEDVHEDKGLPAGAENTPPADKPESASDVMFESPLPAPKPEHPKTPYEFGEDDIVYVHAVAVVPEGEASSSKAFMLEEKGIEDKDFAFALDHRGLRFYLSKIHTRSSTISKTGTLLLNKRESIMMRGRHENILNELRAHGVLLPFEFGTVARGKDELLEKIDSHLNDLLLAVEDISKTTWWEVSVYALDARIATSVAAETASRSQRERSRPSFSAAAASRVDVKTLDRILESRRRSLSQSMTNSRRQQTGRTWT